MNLPFPAPGQQAQVRNWPRRLANTAVAVAVVAVAAAVFVLSYAGVRAVAITGGVSLQLARVYPGVFDAVLVIACVTAILLRDGRWWARAWAWLVVVLLLAAIGATDMLHAMGYTLRHRPTEGLVAAAPVAAVLFAFSLLLTLLRQSRTAADATAGRRAAKHQPDVTPAIAAGAPPRPPAPPIALAAASGVAGPELAATREDSVLEALAEPSPAIAEAPRTQDASQTPHPATQASDVLSPETSPAAESPSQAPLGIRYASSALDHHDYWDPDDDRQFAGQVYPDPRDEVEPSALDFARDSEDDPRVEATVPAANGPRFNRVRSTPTPPAGDED